MLVGMWLAFEPDLVVTSRQTYDILNFLGDVGGLDGTLSIIGYLLVSGYNNLNAYGVLISLLFRKSGTEYYAKRSTMKSKVSASNCD